MRRARGRWVIQALILAALSLAYAYLVVQSIGWTVRVISPSFAGWAEWQVYAHLTALNLLAVLIAALPIVVALHLIVKERAVTLALMVSLPVALYAVVTLFTHPPSVTLNPRPPGEWLVHSLSVVYLLSVPAALTLLLGRLLPPRKPAQAA